MFSHTSASREARAPRAQQRKGFTLIELLVVMTIIAILAAMLFPTFARVRENAKRSSSISQLKQVALGFQQYTQDYDEQLPFNAAGASRWPDVIQPYVASWQIFVTPGQDNFCEYDGSTIRDPNNASATYLQTLIPSYGYNREYLGKVPVLTGTDTGQKLAGIGSPSETVLLSSSTAAATAVGCTNVSGNSPVVGFFRVLPPSLWSGTGGGVNALSYGYNWPRYLNRFNVAFADGHVKSLGVSELGQEAIWDLE